MSTLVIYFSLDGNTKFIAEKIAAAIGAETAELTTGRRYPEKGFWKYFLGGMSVVFGERPRLTNPQIDLSRYETVFIGTPIWAKSYAPPIGSLLRRYRIRNKRIALFACHGGGGAEKCFSKLKEELPGNTFLGEAAYVEPRKNPEAASAEAARWAAGLVGR